MSLLSGLLRCRRVFLSGTPAAAAVTPSSSSLFLSLVNQVSVRHAGHNKWSKIHRAKAINDDQRNQRMVKHLREIMSCARQGGPDPAVNLKLGHLLDKAKQLQVPRANVESALQKAQGKGVDALALTHVLYEGYGPKVRRTF